MIDVNKLRALTEESRENIKQAKEESKRIQEAFEKEMAEKQAVKDRLRAQGVINIIPLIASEAAKRGNDFVFVMDMGLDHQLSTTGQMVFDFCKENGLNPSVDVVRREYGTQYHDGYGYEETRYYGIKISW